jgi:hypothetical protein
MLTSEHLSPTCSLLIDLAEVLDVSVADLRGLSAETPVTRIDANADAHDGLMQLLLAIERNMPLRVCASHYARLIVQRCGGNKRHACQLLAISYHTLQAYLRGPESAGTATDPRSMVDDIQT